MNKAIDKNPPQRATNEPGLTRFTHSLRIYYEDTDAGGVVYYANYLKFLERCRTEWLRALGFDQADLLREHDLAFVVRSVALEYLKPARLDDCLEVDLQLEKITRAQIFFTQRISRKNTDNTDKLAEELVHGTVQIIAVTASAMKIRSIPTFIRTRLEQLT